MTTLPAAFRHRVIALTADGTTTGEIADALGVRGAWVRSIKALHRSGASLEPESRANERTSLAGREGERIRARIRAKPGTTLEDLKRALRLDTSIPDLWLALKELEISLKQTAPRHRTGTPRRRRRPRGLEGLRRRHRPPPPRLPRRNLRHRRHDPPRRVGADARAGPLPRAPRALEDHHPRRRLPPRRDTRPAGRRRRAHRPTLRPTRPTGTRPATAPRRHPGPGQPANPQGQGRERRRAGGRCQRGTPAALQPRPRPHRTGLLQDQERTPAARTPHDHRPGGRLRRSPRLDHADRRATSSTRAILDTRQEEIETAVIHLGGNDERCPPGHSGMLYRALKEYVNVPTQLVVYPGEPHGLTKLSNRKAKMEWDLAWFDRYVKGKD